MPSSGLQPACGSIGLPPIVDLPPLCTFCRVPIASDATHLLVCRDLITSRASECEQWPHNLWDMRHADVRDTIATSLVQAGVAVTVEPGPLAPEHLDRPDHLFTFRCLAREGPETVRIATDVTVVECNSAAAIRNGKSVATTLRGRAGAKCRTHQAQCTAAGIEFVPLVFASLGAFDVQAASFLQLDRFQFDARRLEALFGGHVNFTNGLIDAVSCALARGTARVCIASAERLRAHHDREVRRGERPQAAAAAAGAKRPCSARVQAPVEAVCGAVSRVCVSADQTRPHHVDGRSSLDPGALVAGFAEVSPAAPETGNTRGRMECAGSLRG